jgi:hypothetical protein
MLNDKQIKAFIKKAQRRYVEKEHKQERLRTTIITSDVIDTSSEVFDEMKKVPHTT